MHPVTTEDHITALAALRARRTIGELVASLSDRQRTILDLRLRRGLSTQETATSWERQSPRYFWASIARWRDCGRGSGPRDRPADQDRSFC